MLRKDDDWQKIIRPVLDEKSLQFVQLCPNVCVFLIHKKNVQLCMPLVCKD